MAHSETGTALDHGYAAVSDSEIGFELRGDCLPECLLRPWSGRPQQFTQAETSAVSETCDRCLFPDIWVNFPICDVWPGA